MPKPTDHNHPDERTTPGQGYGAGPRDTRTNPDDPTPSNDAYYSDTANERTGHGKPTKPVIKK